MGGKLSKRKKGYNVNEEKAKEQEDQAEGTTAEEASKDTKEEAPNDKTKEEPEKPSANMEAVGEKAGPQAEVKAQAPVPPSAKSNDEVNTTEAPTAVPAASPEPKPTEVEPDPSSTAASEPVAQDPRSTAASEPVAPAKEANATEVSSKEQTVAVQD